MLEVRPTGEQGNAVLPPGFNTVTPSFFVANAESFVRFLVQGLGGTETCRRLGGKTDARASYQLALALAKQEPERRFLDKRLVKWTELLGRLRKANSLFATLRVSTAARSIPNLTIPLSFSTLSISALTNDCLMSPEVSHEISAAGA